MAFLKLAVGTVVEVRGDDDAITGYEWKSKNETLYLDADGVRQVEPHPDDTKRLSRISVSFPTFPSAAYDVNLPAADVVTLIAEARRLGHHAPAVACGCEPDPVPAEE